MLRVILPLLLLAGLLAGCGSDASDEPPVDVRQGIFFDPESAQLAVGGGAEFALRIEHLDSAVFAISLQIQFDETVTAFDANSSVLSGEFFGTTAIGFAQAKDSKVHITISRTQGESSTSGTGSLCLLHFSGMSAGADTLRVLSSALRFYDSQGEVVSVPEFVTGTLLLTVQ